MKNYGFTQLFEKDSSTFTYIIWDKETKEGVLIDSVLEQVERDDQYLKELGINVKYFLETHVHADHVAGIYKFMEKYPKSECVYGENSGVDKNVIKNVKLVKDGEKITFGKGNRLSIEAIATPGHTNGCISYYFKEGNFLFTGDAIHVRACGRTDFQQGSNKTLYNSIKKIYDRFEDSTIIYPGHDYKVFTRTELGEVKKYNKRLREGQSFEAFDKSMNEVLKTLPLPQKIFFAVPANFNGGVAGVNLMHDYKGKKLFALAGLTEEAFRLGVKKSGIKTYFHLSTDLKEKELYEKVAKELGVTYHYLPFTPSSITNEKLDGYCKMVDDSEGNICTSCKTENRSRFMAYYYLKKKNAENVDYEEILKYMHGKVMISYLKKMDDKDFTEGIASYFKRMAGASVNDVCTASPASAKHSECGM